MNCNTEGTFLIISIFLHIIHTITKRLVDYCLTSSQQYFITRTSSLIFKNYIQMREGWRNNPFLTVSLVKYRELGGDKQFSLLLRLFFFSKFTKEIFNVYGAGHSTRYLVHSQAFRSITWQPPSSIERASTITARGRAKLPWDPFSRTQLIDTSYTTKITLLHNTLII